MVRMRLMYVTERPALICNPQIGGILLSCWATETFGRGVLGERFCRARFRCKERKLKGRKKRKGGGGVSVLKEGTEDTFTTGIGDIDHLL